jgi:Dockerin type I domain
MNIGDPNTRHDGEEPKAPAKLVAALKEPPSRRVCVPPTMDAAIIGAARRHLTNPERAGFNLFRSWLVWPGLATACVIMAAMLYFFLNPLRTGRSIANEDVNHDGKVDILDAFQLARDVRNGARLPSNLDLNHDGVVDKRDAEFIASDAVKLEKGRRS